MLSIGIDYCICGTLNPRLLKPFIEADRQLEERIDTRNWLLGGYVHEAVSVAISNALRKKGAKANTYRDKSYMAEKHERDIEEGKVQMTEREKADRVRQIFEQINATLMANSPEVRGMPKKK